MDKIEKKDGQYYLINGFQEEDQELVELPLVLNYMKCYALIDNLLENTFYVCTRESKQPFVEGGKIIDYDIGEKRITFTSFDSNSLLGLPAGYQRITLPFNGAYAICEKDGQKDLYIYIPREYHIGKWASAEKGIDEVTFGSDYEGYNYRFTKDGKETEVNYLLGRCDYAGNYDYQEICRFSGDSIHLLKKFKLYELVAPISSSTCQRVYRYYEVKDNGQTKILLVSYRQMLDEQEKSPITVLSEGNYQEVIYCESNNYGPYNGQKLNNGDCIMATDDSGHITIISTFPLIDGKFYISPDLTSVKKHLLANGKNTDYFYSIKKDNREYIVYFIIENNEYNRPVLENQAYLEYLEVNTINCGNTNRNLVVGRQKYDDNKEGLDLFNLDGEKAMRIASNNFRISPIMNGGYACYKDVDGQVQLTIFNAKGVEIYQTNISYDEYDNLIIYYNKTISSIVISSHLKDYPSAIISVNPEYMDQVNPERQERFKLQDLVYFEELYHFEEKETDQIKPVVLAKYRKKDFPTTNTSTDRNESDIYKYHHPFEYAIITCDGQIRPCFGLEEHYNLEYFGNNYIIIQDESSLKKGLVEIHTSGRKWHFIPVDFDQIEPIIRTEGLYFKATKDNEVTIYNQNGMVVDTWTVTTKGRQMIMSSLIGKE